MKLPFPPFFFNLTLFFPSIRDGVKTEKYISLDDGLAEYTPTSHNVLGKQLAHDDLDIRRIDLKIAINKTLIRFRTEDIFFIM